LKGRHPWTSLWIVAALLAAVLLVGTSKMFGSRQKMASVGAAAEWVLDFSPGAIIGHRNEVSAFALVGWKSKDHDDGLSGIRAE
jgi:hypothetical protein